MKQKKLKLPQNHVISKSSGKKMVDALESKFSKDNIDIILPPVGLDFNRNLFDTILKNQECVGVRFRFGLTDSSSLSLIITGIDKNRNEILLPLNKKSSLSRSIIPADEGGVGDMGQSCPLYDTLTDM